jgi:Flp pilus assembly protein TadG
MNLVPRSVPRSVPRPVLKPALANRVRSSLTDDSGYVTAETALSLPSLLAVAFALLLIVLAAGDQVRCADAAWEAARLAARGEPVELAEAQVKRWMPTGSVVSLTPGQGAVEATVSVRLGLGGSLLPAVRISSTAQVSCETGLPCAAGGA